MVAAAEPFRDGRYCLTSDSEAFVDMTAENLSVGTLCRHIARERLGEAYRRDSGPLEFETYIVPEFDPQRVFWAHKKDWAGKPLYLIQIAVCRRAIKEMEKAEKVMPLHDTAERMEKPITSAEKSEFIEKVTKEIKRLRRRKRAILPEFIGLPNIDEECREFNAGLAVQAKKLLKERKE